VARCGVMAFVAAIDSDRHKYIWSRAVTSLAGLSEHVKFVITETALVISAVNAAKTSNGKVEFERGFFHEYEVNFGDREDMVEGYEEAPVPSYSFVVNSKHLSILFKNLDVGDLDYVCCKIHWSRRENTTLNYKLLFEIKTRRMIVKKYQMGYQPVLRGEESAAAQNYRADGSVRYIRMDQQVVKQFLDMIPPATEDFRIDTKNGSLQLCGYTQQIMRDRAYLKQPMSVTIAIGLDELVETNLKDDGTNEVHFRLKDFRNFVTLLGVLTEAKRGDLAPDNHFDILYRDPGDVVVFETKPNSHLLVEFIQVTGAREGGAIDKTSLLPSHVLQKILPKTLNVNAAHTMPRPSQARLEPQPLFLPELSQPDLPQWSHAPAERVSLDDTDYESDGNHAKRHKQDDALGPTQGVDRPKSIFD
jgi:DNA damage checkpoint protein